MLLNYYSILIPCKQICVRTGILKKIHDCISGLNKCVYITGKCQLWADQRCRCCCLLISYFRIVFLLFHFARSNESNNNGFTCDKACVISGSGCVKIWSYAVLFYLAVIARIIVIVCYIWWYSTWRFFLLSSCKVLCGKEIMYVLQGNFEIVYNYS